MYPLKQKANDYIHWLFYLIRENNRQSKRYASNSSETSSGTNTPAFP